MQNNMKYLVLNVFVLFLGCTILSGCASTIQLNSIDEVPDHVEERTVIVHTASGQDYIGDNVQVKNDSLHLEEDSTKHSVQIPGKEIKSIETWNRSTGFWEGIALGAVSVGAPFAILANKNDGNHINEDREMQKIVNTFFTVIVATGGAIAGAIVGSSIGHHYTYVFPEDSLKKSESNDLCQTDEQTRKAGSVFVTGNLGCYLYSPNNDFSRCSLVPEIGAGIYLNDNLLCFSTKLLYCSKSATQWDYQFIEIGDGVTTKTDIGSEQYTEWLMKAGLQYTIPLFSRILLDIEWGMAYTSVTTTFKSNSLSGINGTYHHNTYGMFAGFGMERRFDRSPFAIITDAQYHRTDEGGFTVSIGLKYYL